MIIKSHTFHNYRADNSVGSRTLPRSGVSARRSQVISPAAAPPTLVIETKPDATPLEGRYVNFGPGIFLSRGECLEVLTRITDSCLANSSGSSAVGYDGQQDADNEAGLMSQVFDALYDDAEEVFLSKRGYVIPRREAALVEATGGSPTYGEITGQGVTQFLRSVPLQADDVLVDLGSGLGRLVLQVAASARLRRCVGLELSASRHEQACWVASQLAQLDCPPPEQEEEPEDAAASADPRVVSSSNDGGDEAGRTFVLQPRGSSASSGNGSVAEPPQLVGSGASGSGPAGGSSRNAGQAQQQAQGSVAVAEQEVEEAERCGPGQVGGGLLLSPVELRCEDLMTVDLADGSAFFLCSTAFSGAACRAIAERLARHPRFRLLVTSRALPFPAPLTLLGQFPCDFSWTARGMAYVYVRSLREAPAGLLAAFLSSTASAIADAAGGHSGGAGPATVGGEGGIAWLPSTCTLSMVPGDLMV